MLYENTGPTCQDTQNIVITFAEEYLRKFFLKQSLQSTTVSAEMKKELFAYLERSYETIGVKLTSFNITLFKKAGKNIVQENKVSNFFVKQNLTESEQLELKETKSESEVLINSVDEQNELDYNETDTDICPQCKNKMIKGSIFCHRCGYKKI